ncbi:unnamed protein product [Prorocentrum cordatum]|uniref:Uncharacterized protein n=1 Tax=Prorocentrum cordatum TaxID=2364126 RepID=A0ABN9SLT6_9DINO|nr:unnamed protein product [Polarella glacialis]
MSDKHLSPDLTIYNSVLKACARAHDAGAAEGWLARMEAKRVPPDAFSFGSVIDSCARGGNSSGAVHWLQRMRGGRLSPSVPCYAGVATAFSRSRDTDGALRWFEEIGASRLQPDVAAWTAAIGACSSAGRWKESRGEPADEPPTVSDAVAKARKAVAALRRLGIDDTSSLLIAARRQLQEAEEAERAARTPDDQLRRSSDRQVQKSKEVAQLCDVVAEHQENFETRNAELQLTEGELTAINSEVQVARAAALATATAGEARAIPDTDVDDALERLGKIVQAAPSVTAGNEGTYLISHARQFQEVVASVAKQRTAWITHAARQRRQGRNFVHVDIGAFSSKSGAIAGSSHLEQGWTLGGSNVNKLARIGEVLSFYALPAGCARISERIASDIVRVLTCIAAQPMRTRPRLTQFLGVFIEKTARRDEFRRAGARAKSSRKLIRTEPGAAPLDLDGSLFQDQDEGLLRGHG